jgi:hypothetical protein
MEVLRSTRKSVRETRMKFEQLAADTLEVRAAAEQCLATSLSKIPMTVLTIFCFCSALALGEGVRSVAAATALELVTLFFAGAHMLPP